MNTRTDYLFRTAGNDESGGLVVVSGDADASSAAAATRDLPCFRCDPDTLPRCLVAAIQTPLPVP